MSRATETLLNCAQTGRRQYNCCSALLYSSSTRGPNTVGDISNRTILGGADSHDYIKSNRRTRSNTTIEEEEEQETALFCVDLYRI